MKKIILLSILMGFVQQFSFGQTGNWLWAKGAIGSHISEGAPICTDANGNVIIAGSYADTSITFGSFTVFNSQPNHSDIYIAKFNSSGNALWLKTAGGINNDSPISICTDSNGNVFMAGNTESPICTFGSVNLVNGSSLNMFVFKYDSNGNEMWGRNASGLNYTGAYGVSTNGAGNVILTGTYNDTMNVGTTTLISSGGFDAFLLKYDTNGNLMWGKTEGGTGADESYAVNVDGSGNIIMVGIYFSPSIAFGSFTLNNASGTGDIYIVKYDSTGNVVWAKSGNGNNGDYVQAVCTDVNGDIFITGGYNSTSLTFNSSTLNCAGGLDVFFVKYSSSGNILWAKSAGGVADDYGYSISPDGNGNIYLTGGFASSTITFNSDTLTQPTIFTDPMFIIKFDSDGNILCSDVLGSGGDDQSGVSTDLFGYAYVAGDFIGSFIIGADTLTQTHPGETGFVSKYYCPTSHDGINEHISQETILIYPNPFTLQTTINFAEEQKNTTIRITDVLGKEIKIINFTGKQLIIDKGDMKAGIYFVQTLDEKKKLTNNKIIIR